MYGLTEPAVTLDESETAGDSERPLQQEKTATDADEGLSMLQKLFFVGVILGVIAIFLRTRKDPISQLKERNMA